MAKRFTATEKWDKEWFQKLKPKHKCLWLFLCDRCDAAGIWESNFSLASFSIGEKITSTDIEIFGDRVIKISPEKFLIKSFIEYQYGKLSKDCKPHLPIIKILEKNNIEYETLSKGYTKGIDTLKEKEKDKEMEEEKEKEKVKEKEKDARAEKIVLPFEDETFVRAWEGWKEYKKSAHNFNYRGKHSEQIALKRLTELARGDLTEALKIIEQSIGNGWEGLFEIKNKLNGKSNGKQSEIINTDGSPNWDAVRKSGKEFLRKQGLG